MAWQDVVAGYLTFLFAYSAVRLWIVAASGYRGSSVDNMAKCQKRITKETVRIAKYDAESLGMRRGMDVMFTTGLAVVACFYVFVALTIFRWAYR